MSSTAVRSDRFDRLPKSALRRIAHFLNFNPQIPIEQFRTETNSLFKLSTVRQEQWLELHREDLWKEFVFAGTPTVEYLTNGSWSYESILRSLAHRVDPTIASGTAQQLELRILAGVWKLVSESPNSSKLKSATLEQLRQKLSLPSATYEIQREVEQLLAAESPEAVKLTSAAILSWTSKSNSGIERLLPPTSIRKSGIIGWLTEALNETIKFVDAPNSKKTIPVVLEIIFDRHTNLNAEEKKATVNQPATNIAENSPKTSFDQLRRPSRAEVIEEFRRSLLELERFLRMRFPPGSGSVQDRRTFGQIVEAAEESGRYRQHEVQELRKINWIRNDLFHLSHREVEDHSVINATELAKSWIEKCSYQKSSGT